MTQVIRNCHKRLHLTFEDSLLCLTPWLENPDDPDGKVIFYRSATFNFGIAQSSTALVVGLTPERKKPLVALALIAVMFSVITCFQFHVYPIRQFAAYATRKLRGRGVDELPGKAGIVSAWVLIAGVNGPPLPHPPPNVFTLLARAHHGS